MKLIKIKTIVCNYSKYFAVLSKLRHSHKRKVFIIMQATKLQRSIEHELYFNGMILTISNPFPGS